MSFLDKIQSFFALAKETNYNLQKIYEQEPNGVLICVLIVLFLIFLIVFFIRRSVKTSSAVKLVSNIQASNSIDDYDSKLSKIVTELPKRGIKVANSINASKKDILEQELKLLENLDISEKITRYEQISSQYKLMAKNSKKYKIEELTSFYEDKSKSLLDENLFNEIQNYVETKEFDENDSKHINSIVSYANSTNQPEKIIEPLKNTFDAHSYGYNLNLFKMIKGLDETKASCIYEHCDSKLKELFRSGEGEVSLKVLNHMLQNDKKEEVYKYISSLQNKTHLKSLYNDLFSKTDDIEMDLAFVSNETKIDADYKTHLDNKLTQNWKDVSYLKYVIESKGVLETIGHIDYRNVLERIESLETRDETNKAVAQALEIARKAEAIANEAKAIARNK